MNKDIIGSILIIKYNKINISKIVCIAVIW